MRPLQHNMWITNARKAVLSIITGGGKWVGILSADPLYQQLLFTAEKKFWRCVESGDLPRLYLAETPRPRLEAVRIVDMTGSNAWAQFTALFCQTRTAFVPRENDKADLKALIPSMPGRRMATAYGQSRTGAIASNYCGGGWSKGTNGYADATEVWPCTGSGDATEILPRAPQREASVALRNKLVAAIGALRQRKKPMPG